MSHFFEANDPRSPLGDERWGDGHFTKDPKEQSVIANLLLSERFPNIVMEQIPCDPVVPGNLYFFDASENSKRDRIVYVVSFLDYGSEKHVNIYWNRIMEFIDPTGAIFHLEISNSFDREKLDAVKLDLNQKVLTVINPMRDKTFRPLPKINFLEVSLSGQWMQSFPKFIFPWRDFLKAYGAKDSKDYDWVIDLGIELSRELKEKFVFDAISSPELIPADKLMMVGIGPLEDILDETVMEKLESFERSHHDKILRDRLGSVLSGMYVHGDPLEIQMRWCKLVKKVCAKEVLVEIDHYVKSLEEKFHKKN